jgi:hypothetical protein
MGDDFPHFDISSISSSISTMHYQNLLAALVIFSGVVAALPSVHADGGSSALTRRGGKKEECVECPKDSTECRNGCLYIVCEKEKCKDKDCCEKKGLEEGKPYVTIPRPLN